MASRNPIPDREEERQLALERYRVLDTPPEAAFDKFTRLAASAIDVPIALVSLVDTNRQWFKSRHGLNAEQTPRDVAFCAHAICGEDLMIVSDTLADPRFAENPLVTGDPRIRFYAGAPLRTPDGYNLGTFCVIDRKPRVLSPGHRTLLTDLSILVMEELELRKAGRRALVELATEQQQARASLRLAQTDPLTGCFNRRGFDAMADRELARAHRHARPLSLLMLDVDHFKSINDTHGHCAGDRVLKAVVETTQNCMRPPDILARFGGEEFVVLAPETPIDGAFSFANRLREALAETEVRTRSDALRFTVSIGVADCDGHSGALDRALERADTALYRAKAGGKNSVRAENRPSA